MSLLHILKSEPDTHTRALMRILSEGEEATEFNLYDGPVDYEKLVDMIFEYEQVITWW